MNGKSILIISYVFPPFPGIGGRRWAKFCKYLSRQGNSVYVLAAKNPLKKESVWNEDISGIPSDRLKRCDARYPKALLTSPASFWGKIKYSVAIRVIKIFVKGNYYDRSIFWQGQIKAQLKKIISEKKIKHVIASGPPFSLCYHTALEIDKYPDVKFYMDYRDPWNLEDWGYQDPSMASGKRYKEELRKEAFCLKKFHKVFTVSEFSKNKYFNKIDPGGRSKLHVIKNGYDEDDFFNAKDQNSPIDISYQLQSKYGKIKVVHIGTIGIDHIDSFELFLKGLVFLQENNMELFSKLDVSFYGNVADDLKKRARKYGLNSISFFSPVVNNIAIQKILESDICLWFKFKQSSGDFATKFYEYVRLRKYILLFSTPGEVSEYIKNNALGYHIETKNDMEHVLSQILEAKLSYNYHFSVKDLSIQNITDSLIAQLD
jgi:glycosyltransferase involved in cell wall biosynthesis